MAGSVSSGTMRELEGDRVRELSVNILQFSGRLLLLLLLSATTLESASMAANVSSPLLISEDGFSPVIFFAVGVV